MIAAIVCLGIWTAFNTLLSILLLVRVAFLKEGMNEQLAQVAKDVNILDRRTR